MVAVVDTGPLFAVADRRDRDHARCLEVLQRVDIDFVIPALVVTEAADFMELHLGALVEARFIRELADWEVEPPRPEDWPRMADLIQRYADFPLGTVDACVAVTAERFGTDLIVTLDNRHFRALRMSDGRPFRILPE